MRFNWLDKRDANHDEIVNHLRKLGIEVVETERPVDVLIHHGGRSGWGEIKVPGGNVRRTQVQFISETKMPVAFIRTTDEAVYFAETFDGLTQSAKDRLAKLLLTHPKNKDFSSIQIEAAILGHVVRKKNAKV